MKNQTYEFFGSVEVCFSPLVFLLFRCFSFFLLVFPFFFLFSLFSLLYRYASNGRNGLGHCPC